MGRVRPFQNLIPGPGTLLWGCLDPHLHSHLTCLTWAFETRPLDAKKLITGQSEPTLKESGGVSKEFSHYSAHRKLSRQYLFSADQRLC